MVRPDDRVGCLLALVKVLGLGPRLAGTAPPSYPYRLRDDFLSPAEKALYRTLMIAAADRWLIFPKVRVADVLFVQRVNGAMGHQNRIDRKHLDFVICDREDFRPLAAVELDDASHARPDRVDRDAFLDAALAAAGLPLVRVEARRTYAPQDLLRLLTDAIAGSAKVPPIQSPLQAPQVRVCPKCGVAMVERVSRHGRFLGCPNFPRCRETAPMARPQPAP